MFIVPMIDTLKETSNQKEKRRDKNLVVGLGSYPSRHIKVDLF